MGIAYRAQQHLENNTINELREKISDMGAEVPRDANKGELARKLAELEEATRRRGSAMTSVSELQPGDTMRNKWDQNWKVREVSGGSAYIQRLDRRGLPKEEYQTITSLDGWSVQTSDDTRRFWDDYEKEGGHRIM